MRIAVLGAGYAGLTVARRLERLLPNDVELVVVDESESHLVQHELHRIVRHPDLAETITVPLEELFSRATVRQARVTEVDTDRGLARLENDDGTEETLGYDFAAVCLGAETEFYDLPGVEASATPLKRLEHARKIRTDAFSAVGGDAIVGGAGLSGVQVAGELAELSEERALDLDVTVVEMADQVAPGFDATFAATLREELEARDVTVETGATVEEADEEAVHLADGRELPHDVFVWAGGIRGPSALGGERLSSGGDLRVGDSTFVVGDAGAIVDADGRSVPASAQTAVREARTAATNIARLVDTSRSGDESPEQDASEELEQYYLDSPGWVVSVGDGAVARIGPFVLSGDPAKAAKAVIGAGHLGSVGAIEQASTLVHEELGWPKYDAVDLPFDLRALADRYETDPATLGELQSSLLGTGLALSEQFAPGGTVDLTRITRATDREYPGSPANLLERTVTDSIGMLFATSPSDSDDEREE